MNNEETSDNRNQDENPQNRTSASSVVLMNADYNDDGSSVSAAAATLPLLSSRHRHQQESIVTDEQHHTINHHIEDSIAQDHDYIMNHIDHYTNIPLIVLQDIAHTGSDTRSYVLVSSDDEADDDNSNTDGGNILPSNTDSNLADAVVPLDIQGTSNAVNTEQNNSVQISERVLDNVIQQFIHNRNGQTAGQSHSSTTNNETVSPDCTRKRRKRSMSTVDKSPVKKQEIMDDDSDEESGTTCSICLDKWESDGNHRLVALKCGHLFGDSCIRRWIRECPNGLKTCPTCKSRTNTRQIYNLYARKISVVDKSEEYRLANLLTDERLKCTKLKEELRTTAIELVRQKNLVETLQNELDRKSTILVNDSIDTNSIVHPQLYRIFLSNTIELSKEIGCRVITYSERKSLIIASQKSASTVFPGYGLRLIDTDTFRPIYYIHVSAKQVRDISLDLDEDLISAASMESNVKIFNINNRSLVTTVNLASDRNVWTTAFSKTNSKLVYLGTQSGSTYAYDLRYPQRLLAEYIENDVSTVINICPIVDNTDIPYGGFLVCKLQSIWFHEYTSTQTVLSTKLDIEGTFNGIQYNELTNYILITTRPTVRESSIYYVATLRKLDNIIILDIISKFMGSSFQQVMGRSTHFKIENDCIVAAYLQDTRMLTTWNTARNRKMQSLQLNDVALDLCPMKIKQNNFLCALTNDKCRIYTITSNGSYD